MDVDEQTLNDIKDEPSTRRSHRSPSPWLTSASRPWTMCIIIQWNLKRDYSWDSFSPFPAFVDTGSTLVDKVNVDLYLKARQEAQAK